MGFSSLHLGALFRRLSLLLFLGVAAPSGAVLVDRGPDMVYDTVLNITWTRQAGDGVARTWAAANAWAAALVFGGFDDWRLPYASVSAGVGPINTLLPGSPCFGTGGADEVACRDNEMGYMFYYNLGGTPGSSETGTQTAVGGEMLTGIQGSYWSGTAFGSNGAWEFFFVLSTQHVEVQFFAQPGWAVRPGDVPEPSSLLLLGLGALALSWARRRKS